MRMPAVQLDDICLFKAVHILGQRHPGGSLASLPLRKYPPAMSSSRYLALEAFSEDAQILKQLQRAA